MKEGADVGKHYGKKIIISFFFALSVAANAQNSITSDLFFQRSLAEMDRFLTQDATSRTFRPSWLEELEFRTETDEFDFDRQEYLVRLSPSTRRMRQSQLKLRRLYQKEAHLELDEWRETVIESAYFRWIDYYFVFRELALYQDLLVVLEDQEKVLQKLLRISDNRLKDLLDLQRELSEVELEIYERQMLLNAAFSTDERADWLNMISPQSIENQLVRMSANDQLTPDEQFLLDRELLEAELELEEAEKSRFFDFFQLRYQGPHADGLDERVSLSAGFTLPFSTNRKLKMEELSLEKETLIKKQQVETAWKNKKIKEQLSTLQALFQKRAFIEEMQEKKHQQAQQLAQKQAQAESATPLLLLYQKADQIEQKLDLLKVEKDIYEGYIEVLILKKLLFQQPFVNYLKQE